MIPDNPVVRFSTQKAKKNNNIGTIDNWGDEFEISFWYKVHNVHKTPSSNKIKGTPNILHLSTGDDKKQIGNRVPAIYMKNGGFWDDHIPNPK